MSRRARTLSWLAVAAILVFLFAPVVLVVLFSFNGGEGTSPPLEGFSTQWYSAVFEDVEYRVGLEHTLVVALVTVVVTAVVGVLAALALTRVPRRLLAPLNAAMATPLIIPLLFTGLALLVFFSKLDVQLSLNTVIVGHVLITLPLVVFIVGARMARLDPAVIESARDLGASAGQAFRRILLPQVAPALVGAALLVAATSVDELIVTLFVNGGDQTIPVVIYGSFRTGIDPKINAIASMMMAMTVVLTIIAGRFLSPREIAR